jgi:hypothetical protein
MQFFENSLNSRFRAPVLRYAEVSARLPADVVAEWSVGYKSPEMSSRTNSDVVDQRPGPKANPLSIALKPELNPDASPTRNEGIQEYPIDGEALLFDPQTQTLYQLNETALAVWRSCDGRTIRDVARNLTTRFDVEFETALRHARDLMGLFCARSLLSVEIISALEH